MRSLVNSHPRKTLFALALVVAGALAWQYDALLPAVAPYLPLIAERAKVVAAFAADQSRNAAGGTADAAKWAWGGTADAAQWAWGFADWKIGAGLAALLAYLTNRRRKAEHTEALRRIAILAQRLVETRKRADDAHDAAWSASVRSDSARAAGQAEGRRHDEQIAGLSRKLDEAPALAVTALERAEIRDGDYLVATLRDDIAADPELFQRVCNTIQTSLRKVAPGAHFIGKLASDKLEVIRGYSEVPALEERLDRIAGAQLELEIEGARQSLAIPGLQKEVAEAVAELKKSQDDVLTLRARVGNAEAELRRQHEAEPIQFSFDSRLLDSTTNVGAPQRSAYACRCGNSDLIEVEQKVSNEVEYRLFICAKCRRKVELRINRP